MSETPSHQDAWNECRQYLRSILEAHDQGRGGAGLGNYYGERASSLWEKVYRETGSTDWDPRAADAQQAGTQYMGKLPLGTVAEQHLGQVGLAAMSTRERRQLLRDHLSADKIPAGNPGDNPDPKIVEQNQQYHAASRLIEVPPDTEGLDLSSVQSTVSELGLRLGAASSLSGLAYLVHATLKRIDEDISAQRPDFGVRSITSVIAPLLTLTKAGRLLMRFATDSDQMHPSAQNELQSLTSMLGKYHTYLTQAVTHYEILRNEHIAATTEIDRDMNEIRTADRQWENIVEAAVLIAATEPPPPLGATSPALDSPVAAKPISTRTTRRTTPEAPAPEQDVPERAAGPRRIGYSGPWSGW